MHDRDRQAIRAELKKQRSAILDTAQRAQDELDALRGAERDPEFEEGAQVEHAQFTLSLLGEAQRRQVALIDAALARLEEGVYGTCLDCEMEIEPRRLRALPFALLCTACASQRELAAGETRTAGIRRGRGAPPSPRPSPSQGEG